MATPSPNNDGIYKISFIMFRLIGENVYETSKKTIAVRAVGFLIYFTLLFFAFASIFEGKEGEGIKIMQTLLIIIHVILKYYCFIYYQPDLQEFLKIRRKFYWNYNTFSNRLEWRKFYQKIDRLQIIIATAAFAVASMYLFVPIFTDSAFLMKAWIFNDSLAIEVFVVFCHYYYFATAVSICVGYDLIYFSQCVDIVVQVKLLKLKLITILDDPPENIGDEVKNCLTHHQLLLGVLPSMKRMYSVMLLFHYFVTLIGACTHIYDFLWAEDTSDIIIDFISTYVFFVEFACYTFPAEAITLEFSDICTSVYKSRWYRNQIHIQKLLLLVMTRSQRKVYFSGGGVIDMNAETFASIVRRTFSFYTILRKVLK